MHTILMEQFVCMTSEIIAVLLSSHIDVFLLAYLIEYFVCVTPLLTAILLSSQITIFLLAHLMEHFVRNISSHRCISFFLHR